jgi:hypothetical protein
MNKLSKFSVKICDIGTFYIGIATPEHSLPEILGFDEFSWSLCSDGFVYYLGEKREFCPPLKRGHIVTVTLH